ncbi:unnamed protein product [Calicophoron daubneyi]|uniref:Phosphatidylinositol transfer protein N-terminal domain-containing protein n=1 Tax=Calicophoron daubneyi TaxID=300641 RepID=A0AAV2TFU5_CALDB
MIIKEYRIVLPMDVEEYRVGQLYAVAEASKDETGGGDGVEVLVNEPFSTKDHPPNPPLLGGDSAYTQGQYTHKCYHLAHKVPALVRSVAPTSALVFNEIAWNAYPYCRTVITNNFMKESFMISIESLHSTDLTLDNPHRLSPEELAKREVVDIDIGVISPDDQDYKADEDPTKFKSQKTGRGPLSPKWWLGDYSGPVMCAYKLVRCECKILFVQGRLEAMIQRQERRLFANFHRQVFCWMDRWIGMTMDDIRRLEDETKRELERQREQGPVRGHQTEE